MLIWWFVICCRGFNNKWIGFNLHNGGAPKASHINRQRLAFWKQKQNKIVPNLIGRELVFYPGKECDRRGGTGGITTARIRCCLREHSGNTPVTGPRRSPGLGSQRERMTRACSWETDSNRRLTYCQWATSVLCQFQPHFSIRKYYTVLRVITRTSRIAERKRSECTDLNNTL